MQGIHEFRIIAEKIRDFCRQELSGWSAEERFWTCSAFLLITVLSVLSDGWDFIALPASLTGVAYTLLAGKGKTSCYIFGTVNVILYGYICWQSKVYGDMALNLACYLPMQIIGFFLWNRNKDKNSGTIIRKTLSWKMRAVFILAAALCWLAGTCLLRAADASSPALDSATTVISIAAMLLGVMRCFEQWIGWTLVNGISVIMWAGIYINDPDTPLATLLMWVIFFICGIVFAWQWYTGSQQESK